MPAGHSAFPRTGAAWWRQRRPLTLSCRAAPPRGKDRRRRGLFFMAAAGGGYFVWSRRRRDEMPPSFREIFLMQQRSPSNSYKRSDLLIVYILISLLIIRCFPIFIICSSHLHHLSFYRTIYNFCNRFTCLYYVHV